VPCVAEEKTVNAAVSWIEKLKIKNGKYNPDDNPNPGIEIEQFFFFFLIADTDGVYASVTDALWTT
jgi:hypothetical protein